MRSVILSIITIAAVAVNAEPTRFEHLSHSARGLVERAKAKAKATATNCKAPGTKGLVGLEGTANCYTTVATDKIDDPVDGLQVGTINGWAGGQIPPALRGIFYLEGNPYAAECMSMGQATYNATTNSFDAHLYRPKTWSSDPNQGQLKNNLDEGVVFQTTCKKNWFGRLRCFTSEWHQNGQYVKHAGDYTADEIADNVWNRASNMRDIPILGTLPIFWGTNIALARYSYKMYRIVDENGNRTPQWEKNYIANINKTVGPNSGQVLVHLGPYQEVPQRR